MSRGTYRNSGMKLIKLNQNFSLIRSLFLAIGLLSTHSALAEQGLQLRGFMTSGVVFSDQEKTYGDEINKRPNFNNDSRLGINLSAALNHQWQMAAQVLFYQRQVIADWYFMTHRPFEGTALRFGRQKFATWLFSDSIDVGNTYPWVRPPLEVYSLNPINAHDSVSASQMLEVGSFELEFAASYGRINERIDDQLRGTSLAGADIDVHDLFGGYILVRNDIALLRTSYYTGKIDATSDLYDFEGLTGDFISIGGKVDWKGLLVLTEWAEVTTNTPQDKIDEAERQAAIASGEAATTGDSAAKAKAEKLGLQAFVLNSDVFSGQAWYVTLGYQFGDWLPHATYAALDTPDEALNYGDQTSTTLGVRYDISLVADVKAEVSYIEPGTDSWGLYQRADLDTTGFEPLTLYSLAVDFVF